MAPSRTKSAKFSCPVEKVCVSHSIDQRRSIVIYRDGSNRYITFGQIKSDNSEFGIGRKGFESILSRHDMGPPN